MLKKLMIGAVAGFLLVGASDVMARTVDAWLVAGLHSASDTVDLEGEDLCMAAVVDLRDMGFVFKGMTKIEPRLAAFYFQKSDNSDAATLFCVANIFEEQSELFGE